MHLMFKVVASSKRRDFNCSRTKFACTGTPFMVYPRNELVGRLCWALEIPDYKNSRNRELQWESIRFKSKTEILWRWAAASFTTSYGT